jgi:hypothetical protein
LEGFAGRVVVGRAGRDAVLADAEFVEWLVNAVPVTSGPLSVSTPASSAPMPASRAARWSTKPAASRADCRRRPGRRWHSGWRCRPRSAARPARCLGACRQRSCPGRPGHQVGRRSGSTRTGRPWLGWSGCRWSPRCAGPARPARIVGRDRPSGPRWCARSRRCGRPRSGWSGRPGPGPGHAGGRCSLLGSRWWTPEALWSEPRVHHQPHQRWDLQPQPVLSKILGVHLGRDALSCTRWPPVLPLSRARIPQTPPLPGTPTGARAPSPV